jgi:hypothetical protein
MVDITQLVKEDHSDTFCLYCGTKKDNHKSEFNLEKHYISFTCKSCNKGNFYKVDFLSNGVNHPYDKKDKKPVLEEIIIKPPKL